MSELAKTSPLVEFLTRFMKRSIIGRNIPMPTSKKKSKPNSSNSKADRLPVKANSINLTARYVARMKAVISPHRLNISILKVIFQDLEVKTEAITSTESPMAIAEMRNR